MLPGAARYFDEVAEEYASRYRARSPGGHALRVRQQRVLELLEPPGGKVLDAGCGPGILARELLDLGYEVWGLDAAPGMIEQCRRRFGRAARARFVLGDVAGMTFPDGFFDAATCIGVIGLVKAYESAVKEMARVVKPGGTLLISFPNALSPYAAWKRFVFYPTVALLRPAYYALAGRPQPPALDVSVRTLHTLTGATQLMARYGAEVTDVAYWDLNVFLSPLDELFPRRALQAAQRMERSRSGKLRWLGTGFILKAKKRA